jgi:hypothetical protein
MVYVVQSYWACFGLYPSSCIWKTKNPTTFRRLDLAPSSGGWGRIATGSFYRAHLRRFGLPHPPADGDRSSLRNVVGFFVFHILDDG